MTEPKKRSAKAAFSLEAARTDVLAKITKAGAKGTGSPFLASTKEPKRSLYVQALGALEAEGAIHVNRSKDKPKYFSIEFAPSVAGAANKIEQLAARQHPRLLTATELKKALAKNESALLPQALELLENEKRLAKLSRMTAMVYAHGDSLRAMLGMSEPKTLAFHAIDAVSSEAVRQAYDDLVRLSGFPDVEIATLQRHSRVPMARLKDWLLDEHKNGRAVFGIGDWSLADEQTRSGVIDMRGDRYLLVRLED